MTAGNQGTDGPGSRLTLDRGSGSSTHVTDDVENEIARMPSIYPAKSPLVSRESTMECRMNGTEPSIFI